MAGPTIPGLPERLLDRPPDPGARRRRSIRAPAPDASAAGLPLGARRHRPELRSLGYLRRTPPSQASLNYLNVFGVIQGSTSSRSRTSTSPAISANRASSSPGPRRRRRRARRRVSQGKADPQSGQSFQTGDLAGQGAPTLPVAGDFDVREAFAEAQIPIVEEDFIHELTLEAGYRYSWYEPEQRPQLSHRHLQDVGSIRSDPGCPVPRGLQPGGSRAEHPGAVRSAVRRSGRQRPILAPALPSPQPTSGCLAQGLCRRSDARRRTRPASITACSAATRT